MNIKEKKEISRKKRWSKRVCLKSEQHFFLKKEMKNLKYKTLAGTLDFIINCYKKERRCKK